MYFENVKFDRKTGNYLEIFEKLFTDKILKELNSHLGGKFITDNKQLKLEYYYK